MRSKLERLMGTHAAYRVLVIVVCQLMTGLTCLWLWTWPVRQQLWEYGQYNPQRWQRVLSLQTAIAALPKAEPLPDSAPLAAFSAMSAVKKSGGRLVTWVPDPRHSVLEMLLPWPNVPPLFRELANYASLKIPAFSLSEAGEEVRVSLTLEFNDESR